MSDKKNNSDNNSRPDSGPEKKQNKPQKPKDPKKSNPPDPKNGYEENEEHNVDPDDPYGYGEQDGHEENEEHNVDPDDPYGYGEQDGPESDKTGVPDSSDSDDPEDDPDYDFEQNPEKRMPFLDHLEELRWTLFKSIGSIVLAAIVAYLFSREIIMFLRVPAPDDLTLIFLGPTEGFMVHIKVALFTGLVAALPIVAYQFWKFVVPGLLEKERQLVPPIVFFTVFCFFVGALFAYTIIIPLGMRFLLGFQYEYLQANITINKYLGFVVTIILVFGVVFELPVLSFFLTKVGVVNPNFLNSKRRYGIVIIFIMAALLTPPDIVTQLLLAIPLIGLYEVSIWVSRLVYDEQLEKEGVIKKIRIKRPFIVWFSGILMVLSGIAGMSVPLTFQYLPRLKEMIFSVFPLQPRTLLFVFVGYGLFLLVNGVALLNRRNWARWLSLLGLAAGIGIVYYFVGYSVWFAVPVGIYLLVLLFLILPASASYFTRALKIQLKEQD